MPATVIGRRIETCISHFLKNDIEQALINLFPALDKTAKKRWPDKRVGNRIRDFVEYQEAIIFAIATQNIFRGTTIDGMTFPQAVYKFGRTSIVHEGQLDPRLKFNQQAGFQIDGDKAGGTWHLSKPFILGLIVAVMIAEENVNEVMQSDYRLQLFEKQFDAKELWGQQVQIENLIRNIWNNQILAFR